MVELVDTGDLKSPGHCDCAGSSPASGTTKNIYYNWSHRQVGKAVDCKSAIHQFESGWLLHYQLKFIFLRYNFNASLSGDVRVVECAGLENR